MTAFSFWMVHLPTESWLVMHERQTEPIPGVKADPKREKCACGGKTFLNTYYEAVTLLSTLLML